MNLYLHFLEFPVGLVQLREIIVDCSLNAREDLRVLQGLTQFRFPGVFGCKILFDRRTLIRQRLVCIHIGDPVDIQRIGVRGKSGRRQADHQRQGQQQGDEFPHVGGLLYVQLLKKHRTLL